jgi:hypothetical protein
VKTGLCAFVMGLILAACAAAAAQNTKSQTASADQGSSTASTAAPVVMPAHCGIDDGGFGTPERHFGK